MFSLPSKQFIALSIGCITALFVGELGARFYFFGRSALSYEKVNSFDNLFRCEIVQSSPIDGLEYELKANVNTYYKLKPFFTNKAGFRDDSFSMKRRENQRRIVIIGDSFTMGTGVSHEETFHSIVEKDLNAKNLTKKYELLNFGVSGYNLNEYLALLKAKVFNYSPHEIVIAFCGYNDHFLPQDLGVKEFKLGLKPTGFWKSYLKLLIQIRINKPQNVESITYPEENLNYIKKQLAQIKKLGEGQNAKVSLIFLATNFKPKESNQIRTISEGLNINFIDASILFKGKQTKKYTLNELDSHPNEKAHVLFSKALISLLTAEEGLN